MKKVILKVLTVLIIFSMIGIVYAVDINKDGRGVIIFTGVENFSDFWDSLDTPDDIAGNEFWYNHTLVSEAGTTSNIFNQELNTTETVIFVQVNSTNWENVSITESQISDLTHITDTTIGNCSGDNTCINIIYNIEIDTFSELDTIVADASLCRLDSAQLFTVDQNFTSIFATDWTNVTITESQVLDLSHTIDTTINLFDQDLNITHNVTFESANATREVYVNNTGVSQFLYNQSDGNGNLSWNESRANDLYIKNSSNILGFYRWNETLSVNTSSGKVGIGFGDPNFPEATGLHIVGNTTLGEIWVAPDAGVNDDSRIRLCEDDDCTFNMFWFYDGGINRIGLFGESSGNVLGPHISLARGTAVSVGIGTGEPFAVFDINGTLRASGLSSLLGGVIFDLVGTPDIGINFDGTNLVFDSNNTNYPNSLAWFSGDVSATAHITRTSVFDKSRGDALSFVKDSDYYIGSKGDIVHNRFYGYVNYDVVDYSRPVLVNKQNFEYNETNDEWYEVVSQETIYPYNTTEKGVSLDSEIDVLRQSVYELNKKIKALEALHGQS